MKICKNALDFVQVINEKGDVRICGWQNDGGVIGNLTEQSMEEIFHSTEADLIRERHINGDFSNCNPNSCPYVANNDPDSNAVEVDEIPRFPRAIYLAYENICNYHCVMCTIPDCIKGADLAKREENLNKIDNELRKVLPYVKKISANGLGEVFASKHILQLLSEWKPIADPSECGAFIETNGSMFNQENWKKIENLGQYHLTVTVTVLSFNEAIYQELSGTQLPLQNIINNLNFLKELRKREIINYLVIATVYQEKNFRDLPEFTRRALEEFGADYVRLRPFEPWREATMEEWYRDVRNEYHPCHNEFLEVMKNPIFKNEKVHDWGGGRVSGLGPEPYPRTRARYQLMEGIFCNPHFKEQISKEVKGSKIVIYGMAAVGRALVCALRNDYQIPYCIDKAMQGCNYDNIPIYSANHLEGLDRDATVIVSLDRNESAIVELMKREGFENVISIKKVIPCDKC